MCPRCATLEAEIARLRVLLDTKVRADVLGRLRVELGVTAHQAQVLLLLYRTPGQTVSFDMICDTLPARYTKSADGRRSEHYLRVVVYQLRQKVGPGVIETALGRGYYLTEAGAERLRAAMRGEAMHQGIAA